MISCILFVVSVAERVGDREQQKMKGESEQRKKFLQFKPRKVLSVDEKGKRVNWPEANITQPHTLVLSALKIYIFKRSRV